MTQELEDTLLNLRDTIIAQGEFDEARKLLDLITACAAAGEMVAALGRGDRDAAEFHAQLLASQVAAVGQLTFRLKE